MQLDGGAGTGRRRVQVGLLMSAVQRQLSWRRLADEELMRVNKGDIEVMIMKY